MSDDTAQAVEPQAQSGAWERARTMGFDMAQLEYLMSLTPAERLQRHEQALAAVRAMRKASINFYGYDPRLPEAAE